MDESNTLFSSEATSISAYGLDVDPPSFVVGIAASLCQLGTLELLFDAKPVDSSMDFVKEAIL